MKLELRTLILPLLSPTPILHGIPAPDLGRQGALPSTLYPEPAPR